MKKRNIFLIIILILIIIILGIYIFHQNKKLKNLNNLYKTLSTEVNNNKTALNGVYELGINTEKYEINTGGIIRSYDEYKNIKEQYKIINLLDDELVIKNNFITNDYIYYILEIDNCSEEITDYDVEILNQDDKVTQKVNITFDINTKCGACQTIPVLYLIPVDKDTIDNTSIMSLNYNYDSNSICYKDDLSVIFDKPILYLYPKEETKITVQLEKDNQVITSYPKYKNGWTVNASPNGDLYDKNGKYYYALYWDEKSTSKIDFSEGFYVTKESAINFLEEKLSIIGLNDRERNEFIMYWLPKLENNEQSLVYFELTKEREVNNKLIIKPVPDSLLRINMHIKKVNEKVEIKEQKLESFERIGFSAVEWGGTIH